MNDSQEQLLKELHTAIVGNEKMGHIGIVKRVAELEEKDKNRALRQAGQTGFFTACGIGLTELGKWLFSSH